MKTKRFIAAVISSILIMTACTNTVGNTPSQKSQEASSDISDASAAVSTGSEEENPITPGNSDNYNSSEEITDVSDLSSAIEEPSESAALPEVFDTPECRSSILYCVEDDRILYNDSIDVKTAPASITKMLTASVVLKNMEPDDVIQVGSELELIDAESSRCYISYGQRLTVEDLLTGMLLCSGNDAAYTAAVNTARAVHPDKYLSDAEAVKIFVQMMNETAAEIGMTDSRFMTPDGWDNDAQYVTAADLVKLAGYALSVPEIRSIVGTYEKYVVFESGENITWTNTNCLLDPDSEFYCENAIGIKTGTTDDAGACLLSAFEKNGKTYIAAVLGCSENSDRYELTLKLFDLI